MSVNTAPRPDPGVTGCILLLLRLLQATIGWDLIDRRAALQSYTRTFGGAVLRPGEGGFKVLANISRRSRSVWLVILFSWSFAKLRDGTEGRAERVLEWNPAISRKPPGGGCSGCSQMVKEVIRRLIGQDVARAIVDLLLDLQEALRSDRREVMPFGEILPDQSVVVLHPALFP